jgi:hypothetical protein
MRKVNFIRKSYKQHGHLCYMHIGLQFTTYVYLPPLLALRSLFSFCNHLASVVHFFFMSVENLFFHTSGSSNLFYTYMNNNLMQVIFICCSVLVNKSGLSLSRKIHHVFSNMSLSIHKKELQTTRSSLLHAHRFTIYDLRLPTTTLSFAITF